MTRFALAVAAMAIVAAAPAYARGEGRIEARGGVAWVGTAQAFAGVGGGYDFDLGRKAFVGLDLGADKVLQSGTAVIWSIGGRIGTKVGKEGRLYANGGVGFCCGGSDPYIGAGYQHKFRGQLYGKIEYRRSFSTIGLDINFVGVGLGIGF